MSHKYAGLGLLRRCKIALFRRRNKNLMLLGKASVFTTLSTLMTFVIAYVFTHDATVSMSVSALDIVVKVVLYYVFDVSWEKFFNHF